MEIIYDTIGKGYNSTRRADPYLTGRLLHFLQPSPGKHYLDIGCGTGNYTMALASHGLNFTGVEPSEEMLNMAKARGEQVRWLQGTAEHIPANDETFDGIIATLTIHHWADLAKSMKEIYRVCKPGGAVVFFTATPQQMKGYWLNYYFPQMLRTSIDQMPGFYAIASALTNAGFGLNTTEKYFIKEDLQDQFLYSGKHQPEIYFDENIRNGISSFAALANADEVKEGLAKLRSDLENGGFEAVKENFENNKGDYLFVVGEK
jgi:ubiquinone/menaquinone biosynthesis C-methylase UbiE